MNKQEAAALLGVSIRALERYTQQGKISATYIKGKTRPTVEYDEGELRAFKTELESKLYPHRPSVENTNIDNGANPAHALARLSNTSAGVERLLEVIDAIRPHGRTRVATEAKILLTLVEASAMTNLSNKHLRAAIHSGELKARIIGRGWKIKRADLDSYIKKF
jgi:excisionase family DNA binding protein